MIYYISQCNSDGTPKESSTWESRQIAKRHNYNRLLTLLSEYASLSCAEASDILEISRERARSLFAELYQDDKIIKLGTLKHRRYALA